MNFLIIGDIVGESGLNILKEKLSTIVKNENIDYIIVNGENSAAGRGIKERELDILNRLGVDVITMGNHLYYRKEAKELYKNVPKLLIPANVTDLEGHGVFIDEKKSKKIAVINLLGKVYMGDSFQERLISPFIKVKEIIDELKGKVDYIFIDFHAEATAEKIAMVNYLKEDITCLFGTHTHVQTSDERLIDGKVAYITDVGMTGPIDSVLGLKTDIAVRRFVTGENLRYECSNSKAMMNYIIVKTDDNTNNCIQISRYSIT